MSFCHFGSSCCVMLGSHRFLQDRTRLAHACPSWWRTLNVLYVTLQNYLWDFFPKWILRWPPEGSRWLQDGPRGPPESPKRAQDGPKMGPRWPQDGFNLASDGRRWLQIARRSPKNGFRSLKMGFRLRKMQRIAFADNNTPTRTRTST